MSELHGILPIVYTPFDATGEIIEADVRRLVDHLIAAGAHGLAACGGASEALKLTLAERRRLATLVIEQAAGRVPVIVGVSAATTHDAAALARHARDLGAQAVFATPAQGAVTAAALHDHYAALAAAGAPVMVQDAEVSVTPEHMAELAAAIPGVRYVKEEAPTETGHRISAIRQLTDDRLLVLSGGTYLLDDLARGAVGAIPGSIGVADLVQAYERWRAGDLVSARRAYDHFTPLSFFRRPFPLLAAKEVLRRQGVFSAAYLRAPAQHMLDAQDLAELTVVMATMGPPY
ncbi:MAG TPA: dihydrodipicolinate synthase family protein [Nitrolancea sp.]|nr:dihydrodipicolinate synthase family protein [Nitrolancea sp.]